MENQSVKKNVSHDKGFKVIQISIYSAVYAPIQDGGQKHELANFKCLCFVMQTFH